MAKEVYLKKIIHDTHGELYQFLELDPASGEERVISPLDAGMFRETVPEPELLYIQSKRGGRRNRLLQRAALCRQTGL